MFTLSLEGPCPLLSNMFAEAARNKNADGRPPPTKDTATAEICEHIVADSPDAACNSLHSHFERSKPTPFSFTFAPANVSACEERNLSALVPYALTRRLVRPERPRAVSGGEDS